MRLFLQSFMFMFSLNVQIWYALDIIRMRTQYEVKIFIPTSKKIKPKVGLELSQAVL